MSDYFYASARVRALETGLLGREMLLRLIECASLAEVYALLEEHGVEIFRDREGRVLREETLSARLEAVYAELADLTEESQTREILLWRYPYDCNNVKAMIKCFARNLSYDDLLMPCGTLSKEELRSVVTEQKYELLPNHMAGAASEALSLYARTGDPQRIDLLLDNACYADMLEAAEESGVELVASLIRTKIDLLNLVMCVRIMRMNREEAGKLLLLDALLDGGRLTKDFIVALYESGERSLWEKLLYTDYKRFSELVGSHSPTLTAVERAADNAWMEMLREAKWIACGPEVLVGYLLGMEYEIRNLRVILSGKAAGIDRDVLMERIREGYV